MLSFLLLAASALSSGANPLQARIDACAAAGGGVVSVAPGVRELKPIVLRSGVTLRLERGAVLEASTNLADYAVREGSPVLIGAFDATDVAVEGEGVIDGRGYAFKEKEGLAGESQPVATPVLMRFSRCRDVRLEDFTFRQAAAWGIHLRNSDGVVVRRVKAFSHVNNSNDGIDVESRNVLIEDCDLDTDDDALVFKTESDPDFAVTNVTVRNCRLASSCNFIKFGTGSYGLWRDILVEKCTLRRAGASWRFDWRRRIPGVTERVTGLAAIALEVVDGGRMEDVTVRDISWTEGVQTPLFIRFDRRHEPKPGRPTHFRNVLVENVKGTAESRLACSVTGVPGRELGGVTLRNLDLTFPGGGTPAEAAAPVREAVGEYPDSYMFDDAALPAWGIYFRHAPGVRLEKANLRLKAGAADARPKYVGAPPDRPWVSAEERAFVPTWHGAEFAPGTPETDAVRFWKNGEKTAWVDVNYDLAKAGDPMENLPDLLTFADGRKVASAADWPARRREILDIFEREIYGRMPPKPTAVEIALLRDGLSEDRFSRRRTYRMWFRPDRTGPTIDWFAVVPAHASGRVPVVVHLNYAGNASVAAGRTNHYALPLDTLVARGYAFLSANYRQVTADPASDDYRDAYDGVFELWGPRDPKRMDNTGALMAWAWAYCRGIDLAERIGGIDAKRNVLIGSSRLGKAALLAGAFDTRIAVTVPNQTGAVGVSLMRHRYAETLEVQRMMFPHWYCGAVWKYVGHPERQPFDQHLLLACVAPRALLLECYHKKWFNPVGEFLSARLAAPAWELHGVGGLACAEMPPAYDDGANRPPFGYVRRTECHGLSAFDWKWALDFADRVWKHNYSASP